MPDFSPAPLSHGQTSVVLVHGALVNGGEMGLLRRRLRRQGYAVHQFYYHSRMTGFEENMGRLRRFLEETPGEILHVVGHSMGGVLIRHLFERNPDPRPGRLVAVGSPFLDSRVGRRVDGWGFIGRYLVGKTVHDYLALPREPVWHGARELGVLAGTFPLGVGSLLPGLPGPHDGVVRWEETRLAGIADHATCGLNHLGMLFSRRCTAQIVRFLEQGSFAETKN